MNSSLFPTISVPWTVWDVTNAQFTTSPSRNASAPNKALYTEANRSPLSNAAIIVGFVCFCGVTIIGNLLIIIVIAVDKSLKSSTNILYVSLATADMFVGLLVLPLFGLYVYRGYWSLGYLLCDLWLSVDFVCCMASFFTVMVISYERFRAVAIPLRQRIQCRRKRVRCFVAIVWTAAFLAWVPAIFIIRKLSNVYIEYGCEFYVNKIYVIISSVVLYYIPIVIIVIFILLIAVIIRGSFNRRRQYGIDIAMTGVYYINCGTGTTQFSHTDSFSSTQSRAHISSRYTHIQNNRTNQARSVRMLGLVVITFLVCWVPWVVIWPLESFRPGTVSPWLYETSSVAAYLNSSINPFIYVFSNRKFRRAIKSLICPRR